MKKKIGAALYWVGIAMSLPFIVLIGASIMKIISQGAESQYVNSAFLGIFGAAFSYAVGVMLRHNLSQDN
jgi:hypothetical protein